MQKFTVNKLEGFSMGCKNNLQRKYFYWLMIPFTLFVFRVIAQLCQKYFNFSFLPAFERWHSGVLPYLWLLFFQFVIIVVLAWWMQVFYRGRVSAQYRMGLFLMALGGFYAGIMLLRLSAALTIAEEQSWLGAKIPAFFHIVLASFVIIVSHYHCKFGHKNNVAR